MSKEAMKLALEALEYIHEGANNQGPHTGISWRCVSNKAEPAITALREALAEQPAQQEPVKPFAWANTDDLCADTAFRWCEIGDHKTPVYTSPPAQRTWVGVTMTDREKLRDRYGWNYPPLLVDAVSDILEWKNT